MSFMDAHQSHFGFPQSHASGGVGQLRLQGGLIRRSAQWPIHREAYLRLGGHGSIPGWVKPNRLYVWHIGWRLDKKKKALVRINKVLKNKLTT